MHNGERCWLMCLAENTTIWFMRHGKIKFDYKNCAYDELIEMLSNGSKKKLDNENHGINFESLPQSVELVCHSQAIRALETAKKLQEHLNVGSVEQLDLLNEVKFDKDIIDRTEYKSLEESRPLILKRWFNNQNKAESFDESKARARKIEEFLQNRQEISIILVTHGLFLRLLELYFVHGKQNNITLPDLLNVKPIALGEFVKANFDIDRSLKSIIKAA